MTKFRAGKGTPFSTWDIYVEEPDQLPAYLETEPDNFIPTHKATPEQLRAAATRLEQNATSLMQLAEKFVLLASGELNLVDDET